MNLVHANGSSFIPVSAPEHRFDPAGLSVMAEAYRRAAGSAAESSEADAHHAQNLRDAAPLHAMPHHGANFTPFGAVYGPLFSAPSAAAPVAGPTGGA